MDLIETIFERTGMLHNRFLGEVFTLPYDFDTIKIQPNELVTYRVINDALSRLYTNFMYLYGLTKVSSNVIPDSLSAVAGVSGNSNTIEWFQPGINQNSFSPMTNIGLSAYDRVNVMHLTFSSLSSSYILFTYNGSTMTVSQTDAGNTFNTILSTSQVTPTTNLQFKAVTSIKTIDNYLFVLDAFYNNLYRYDITGLISNESFSSELILNKAIGGFGTFQDKYAFNNPTSMCVRNNNLFVLDAGNYSVKQYDINLNCIVTFQLKHSLIDNNPFKIICDNLTGNFFIICTSGAVVVYDNSFNLLKAYSLVNIIPDFTEIVEVFTSQAFDNFYYIVTDANVYKLYLSKPDNIIGKFTLYRFGFNQELITCAQNVVNENDSSNSSDLVFIMTTSNLATKLLCTSESKNLVSVLALNDFDIFELSDILTSAGEYVQPWVISKAISKLLLNHLRLKDKIKGRFTGNYDSNGIPLLTGTLYFLLNDLDLTAYQITPDHFIGNNEVLSSAAINRGLEKIYNIQLSIINKSNTVVQDLTDFQNQPILLT